MIRFLNKEGRWAGSWEMVIPDDEGYAGGLLGDLNVRDLFPDTDKGDEYKLRSETPLSPPTARVLGFWPSALDGVMADDKVRREREHNRLRKEVTSPRTEKVRAPGLTILQTESRNRQGTVERALAALRGTRQRQQRTMCALAVILRQTSPDDATFERHLDNLQGWWSGLVGTTPKAGPRAQMRPEGGIRYRTPEEVFESVKALLSPMRPQLDMWTFGGIRWDAVGTATGLAYFQEKWVEGLRDALGKLLWYHIPAGMIIAHDQGAPVREQGRGEGTDKFVRVVEALTLLVLMNAPRSSLTLDDAVFYGRPEGTGDDGAGDFIVDRGRSAMSATALFREVDKVLGLKSSGNDSSSLRTYQRRAAAGEGEWPVLVGNWDERVAQIRRAAGKYAERAVSEGRSTAKVYGGGVPLAPL